MAVARLGHRVSAGVNKSRLALYHENILVYLQAIEQRDIMSAVQNDRPTFDTYWRKNKEHTATKSLVFVVQSDPGRPSTKGMLKIENLFAFFEPSPWRQL